MADAPASPGAARRTSDILAEFARTHTAPRISVEEIIEALGDRGLGVLIAIFALPPAIPVPTFPGFTAVWGLPIVAFGIQLMLRRHRLVLPGFLARRTIDGPTFRTIALKVARSLAWIERFLRPRLVAVTGPKSERILGALCAVVALAIAVPLPFGHNVAAAGLALIGLGLIERDGFAILLGVFLALAGVALLALVIFGLAHGLHYLFRL